MKLLVCGGAGFIGSAFVRVRLRDHGDEITVLDKLTYAGRRENLEGLDIEFVHAGIEDADAVAGAMAGVDAVVNFAAETHVDRSIAEPDAFVTTHAVGTWVLLEAARRAGVRYLQVSTDEVYGSIEEGSFTESSPLAPSSPYSATKAGADLLVASYFHTYDLPTVICRGSNNYGPRQYPEKLIPLMVLNALHGDPLPVYGDGMQVRNWLYVEDFARGIGHVLAHGEPGEAYNVGGPDECPNLEVVQRIIELTGASPELLTYVKDRPGHDRRYSLGSEKVRALGWEAQVRFADGLDETVRWYQDNARGGSRSAPATTARTTRGSTARRSRTETTQRRAHRVGPAAGPIRVLLSGCVPHVISAAVCARRRGAVLAPLGVGERVALLPGRVVPGHLRLRLAVAESADRRERDGLAAHCSAGDDGGGGDAGDGALDVHGVSLGEWLCAALWEA